MLHIYQWAFKFFYFYLFLRKLLWTLYALNATEIDLNIWHFVRRPTCSACSFTQFIEIKIIIIFTRDSIRSVTILSQVIQFVGVFNAEMCTWPWLILISIKNCMSRRVDRSAVWRLSHSLVCIFSCVHSCRCFANEKNYTAVCGRVCLCVDKM